MISSPLPDISTSAVDRRANVTIGVVVPLLQSFVTGLLAAMLTWVVLVVFDMRPWKASAVIGILAMAAAWLILVIRWVNVVHFIESATGADIDQDGWVGDPAPTQAIQEVRVVVQDRPGHLKIGTFPVPLSKIIRLCQGLVNGVPFTERAWTGKGRPFSQNEFNQVREIMVEQEWFMWVNDEHHQQGAVPTALGEEVIRDLASRATALNPPPPPGFESLPRR